MSTVFPSHSLAGDLWMRAEPQVADRLPSDLVSAREVKERIMWRTAASGVIAGAIIVAASAVQAHAVASDDDTTAAASVEVVVPQTSAAASSRVCNFQQAGDYAHISGSLPLAVSAHGWWRNVDCRATHAVVTVQVQKQNVLGIWVDVGTRGVATVRSGGGSVNRTVSRYICRSSTVHTFRSWIDVNLVGVEDAPNKLYTPKRKLACN
jgi:hypothetical protein